jgi:uncharacterized protein YdcH (DUF465 family)
MSKRLNDNPNMAIARLEEEHRMLKERVAELDKRVVLTAKEQREALELKKMKLATKDAISELRRVAC